MSSITSSERKWKAQHDAEILKTAAAIRKDKARMKAAKAAAKTMLKEQSDELQGLRNIANLKI